MIPKMAYNTTFYRSAFNLMNDLEAVILTNYQLLGVLFSCNNLSVTHLDYVKSKCLWLMPLA